MNVLFVCTGNTCRSPMAEVYLKSLRPTWEVNSAGVRAGSGQPASEFAKTVVEKMELDLSKHSSRPVDFELSAIDKIWVMSPRHLASFPDGRAKLLTSLLGLERPIEDPYGGKLRDYQRAFEEIRECIDTLAKAES